MTKDIPKPTSYSLTDRIKDWALTAPRGTPDEEQARDWDYAGMPAHNAFGGYVQSYLLQDARVIREVAQPIRNGVKTGAETVSLQIRVLKAHAELLKAASFIEGRPASAVLRELLEGYFAQKCANSDLAERKRWIDALQAMWGNGDEDVID